MQQERAAFAAVIAEDDIFGDGERLDQPEMLVHHADPGVQRIGRRVEVHGTAVEQDLALVRPVEPGQDVRQRALAGPVLAEERMHLARRRLEIDAVVGDNAREALRDPAHRDGGERGDADGASPLLAHSARGRVTQQT